MFTTMTKTVAPVGLIEVRVRHIEDEGDGALLGYFPPEMLESLAKLLAREGVYFLDDGGPYSVMTTQFVAEDERVYYEITFEE